MTPRVLPRRLWLLAGLALLGPGLAAGSARADSAPLPAAEIAVHDVRAGETVTLRWPGLPREARELEVLLSIDGGARYTMRASAELDAARSSVRWRVPALATAHARLRLRWGDGGTEQLLPPTPEFRILAEVPACPTPVAPAPAWDEDDPASAGPLHASKSDVDPAVPLWSACATAANGIVPEAPAAPRAAPTRALPNFASLRIASPPPPVAVSAAPTPRAPRRE
jgi:hypothetical protein